MMYRRIAAAVMALSASSVVGLGVWAVGAPAPRPPVDRSVAYCGPRVGLAEGFHACRNENVLVEL